MSEKNYTWIGFYEELATKLMAFQDDRSELIRKIRKVYEDIGQKLPKLEKDNNPTDIDSFTVFGLFNKGISEQIRRAIIRGIAKEFEIKAALPRDFDGIPTLNNQRAVFHAFKGDPGLGEHDIDNLWRLLAAALVWPMKIAKETASVSRKPTTRCLGKKSSSGTSLRGSFGCGPATTSTWTARTGITWKSACRSLSSARQGLC